MMLGLVGLAISNVPLLIGVVFLMSMQSAFFGPSKYGLLPELLPEEELSWGNGVLQLGTNVAIIIGTVVAGLLSEAFRGRQYISGGVLVALACVGLYFSSRITRVPAADPQRKFRANPIGDLWQQIRLIRQDRVLSLAVMGTCYFSFLGALLLLNVMIYGKQVLALDDARVGLMVAATAVGIGVGAYTAGVLSGRKIEYGLVPLGAAGITLFSGLLAIHDLSPVQAGTLLGLTGFFAGFYVVPVGALLQHRPPRDRKGGILGAANMLSFVGIFCAAGFWRLVGAAFFVCHVNYS